MAKGFATSVVAGVFLAACGVSFPDERRIEDLRILDVSVEPPEIPALAQGTTATTPQAFLDRLLDAPNVETVRMTALVAHPDLDAEVSYGWIGCAPTLTSYPCGRSRQVELSSSTSSAAAFQPIPSLQTQLIATGDPASALRVLGSDPRDLLNGVYAQIILQVSVTASRVPADTSALDAVKRLVIFDPALVSVTIAEARRQVAAGELPDLSALGLPSLCTRATDEEIAAIEVFLATRTRNRAPSYVDLTVIVRGATVSAERPIEVDPGEEIVLRPLAGPDDRERYALIDDNCQLVDRRETLAWSWFASAGSISPAISVLDDASEGEPPSAGYLVPGAAEVAATGGRARIYSVLRDGRGGSRHRTLDIRVRSAGERASGD